MTGNGGGVGQEVQALREGGPECDCCATVDPTLGTRLAWAS